MKIRPGLAAFGLSVRCNDEGADQLDEVLFRLGVELIRVPLPGLSIHLDGHLAMLDHDTALVNGETLPHWFLARLQALGHTPAVASPRRALGRELAGGAPRARHQVGPRARAPPSCWRATA